LAQVRIGTSGYSYRHWREVFYPPDISTGEWFEFYARHFRTVELNVTFYRLPAGTVFQGWARRAPPGFRFVLKGSRYITHLKRLKDARPAVETFFERSAPLASRLACVLWQLPPRFRADAARLKAFLADLHAVAPARRTRHAFEFRDRSWFTDATFDALREANASLVPTDMPFEVVAPPLRPRRKKGERVSVPLTADFVYLRRHGPGRTYGSDYPPAMIRSDARAVRAWLAEGKDVFAFYNNDAKGYAVKNARLLEKLVSA
jgi:uncharacterized protein YecE (DUF72 family)